MTSEDALEIRNVLARIAHYSDTGDLDDYAAQFTDDATWEMPPAPPKYSRAAIREAAATRRAEHQTGPGTHTRHVITTVAVSVYGDTAVADSYWQFYAVTNAAPALRTMGSYHDTFHRTPDGWRLAHRHITPG